MSAAALQIAIALTALQRLFELSRVMTVQRELHGNGNSGCRLRRLHAVILKHNLLPKRLADLDLVWLKEAVRNALPTHPDWKAHFGPTRVLDNLSLVLDIVYSAAYDVVPRNMVENNNHHGEEQQ